jgi:hypothetical protein
MALLDDRNLAQNTDYLYRVEAALVSTALDIQAESVATVSHAARSTYSLKLLADPATYARIMALGMAVNSATTTASTDQQLKDRASAIFNAYAVQS